MKRCFPYLFLLLCVNVALAKEKLPHLRFFKANNHNIQYFGRVDFSDPLKPRFWAGGVYIRIKFKGPSCQVMLNDEELGGNNHNYIEIVVDNVARRIQTTGKANVITIADSLSDGVHEAIICKDTESGIGYLELAGVKCAKLLPPAPKPTRKIEYIGDSITAGAGMDLTIPCNKGSWYDQHNAYMTYGARTSRALDAQWQLTAVAGIGLTHSCCKMDIIMPDVLDKMDQRDNKGNWDFQNYQPDVVTICLGQNDGIVDSAKFCSAYVAFIGDVRKHYPTADIILLTSPMGNAKLTAVLKNYLTSITAYMNSQGDKKIYKYFFSRSFNSGCGGHPDLAEHGQIANELTAYVKQVEGW